MLAAPCASALRQQHILEQLACHASQVQDLIWQEIEKVNSKFARVETIKKFRLIDQLLDPEDDELTPTMKLKRKVVNEKYIDLINEMY